MLKRIDALNSAKNSDSKKQHVVKRLGLYETFSDIKTEMDDLCHLDMVMQDNGIAVEPMTHNRFRVNMVRRPGKDGKAHELGCLVQLRAFPPTDIGFDPSEFDYEDIKFLFTINYGIAVGTEEAIKEWLQSDEPNPIPYNEPILIQVNKDLNNLDSANCEYYEKLLFAIDALQEYLAWFKTAAENTVSEMEADRYAESN